MLKFGGYLNLIIAVAHLIGLLWAREMFSVTGISYEMDCLRKIHASLPYLLTVLVAIVFSLFGIYGLSAANNLRHLPLQKPVIFLIAATYLLRGVGELIADTVQNTNSISETIYSGCAIFIGLLFLIGGLTKSYVPKTAH